MESAVSSSEVLPGPIAARGPAPGFKSSRPLPSTKEILIRRPLETNTIPDFLLIYYGDKEDSKCL